MQTLSISNLEGLSAALRISGPDANTYLQGQFTQDLLGPIGACAYGLWLNQKGKTLADSFVLRLAEQEFYVASLLAENELLKNRLESYLIADEVEIEDRSGRDGALAVWGDGAGDAVLRIFGSVPAAGRFAQDNHGRVFRGRFATAENFLCLAPSGTAALRAEFLALGAREATRDELEATRITSGLPAVPSDIGPDDLPNEGGLERDAISFTKGCYLGQEVMARLKNLGQVRRQLCVVAGRGEPPAPRIALRQGDKVVGQTRSAARTPTGFVAMAMISLVNFEPATPLALEDGRALEVRHG